MAATFIILIIGIVVGVVITKLASLPIHENNQKGGQGLIEKQAKEKEENKQKILGLLETQTPLTNSHVEQLIGISEATATRYFDELEKEGRVRQIGKTGRYVYYELKK
ncbi:MAG: hypothetical protein WCT19_01665 [Candidatus Paceibacterota bacterium]